MLKSKSTTHVLIAVIIAGTSIMKTEMKIVGLFQVIPDHRNRPKRRTSFKSYLREFE